MRKNIINFLAIIFGAILSSAAVHIYKYYPDKLPTMIMNYRIEGLVKESKNLIDEILVVDDRQNESGQAGGLVSLMQSTIAYESFLDDNRLFIDKNVQLKKILSEQLREGLDSLDSKNNNEDFVVEFFNKSIESLQ